MERKTIFCSSLILAVLCFLNIFADPPSGYNVQSLESERVALQNFLFGFPIKLIALVGVFWGIVQALLGSWKPLLYSMAVLLLVVFIPKFLSVLNLG